MVDLAYQSSVSAEGPPGRAYPRLPEEVPGAAFGGQVGHAIETAGTVEQQHVNSTMDQVRQTQYAEGDNQLQALQSNILRDPQNGALTKQGKNAFGLDQQYLPQFDQQAKQIIAAAPDVHAQQALSKAYEQRRTELSSQLDTHELEQHRQYNLQTANDSVALAQQSAADNYNHPDIIAGNLDKLDGSLASLADQQGWSGEQFSEARYEARTKLHQGVLDGMLSDNKVDMAKAYLDSFKGELKPQEAKTFQAAIQSGEVTATSNSILGAFRTDTNQGAQQLSQIEKSGLTPDQQSQVIQSVEKGRNDLAIERRQNPQVRQQITSLDDSIASDNVAPNALDKVEQLWKQGAVTDQQRVVYRDQIERAQKKGSADASLLDYAHTAYQNLVPLDPKDPNDKKAADLLLQESALGAPGNTSAYNNAAVHIASRLGVVPDAAISYGRSNLVGGDPKAAASGAQLLSNLQEANPRAYMMATDPETRAMADTVNRVVQAGGSPEAAVQMARENDQRSKSDQEQLTRQWNARYPVAKDSTQLEKNDLSKALTSDPLYEGTGLPGFKPGVPNAPPALAGEFDDLTHQYFNHTGGNLAQAQQLAIHDLKGTWGVSQVNGSRELMKYAPERMFPGLTGDMVRDDLKTSGHGDAHLTETPETGTSGGKVWNLSEKDQFGAFDVVRDKNGMPLRYQVPEVKAAAAQAQAKQDATDRAKLLVEQQQRSLMAQHEASDEVLQ